MSLNPDYLYRAVVTRVIDGDTIDLDVDLGFYLRATIRFRLASIDTPELNSSDPTVRVAAQSARDRLAALCPAGATVHVQSLKAEKYGRWLAELYDPAGNHVNGILLAEGHAKPYG